MFFLFEALSLTYIGDSGGYETIVSIQMRGKGGVKKSYRNHTCPRPLYLASLGLVDEHLAFLGS
jgi:hypothetical protein